MTYAMNHIANILRKIEAPFSPDFSVAWSVYIADLAHFGAQYGYSNPNVPPDPGLEDVLETYGAVPEVYYPTNYDALGFWAGDPSIPYYLEHPPAANLFPEAAKFKSFAVPWSTLRRPNRPSKTCRPDLCGAETCSRVTKLRSSDMI